MEKSKKVTRTTDVVKQTQIIPKDKTQSQNILEDF